MSHWKFWQGEDALYTPCLLGFHDLSVGVWELLSL